MRIITNKALKKFSLKHPEAKASLDAWYHEVKHRDWCNFADIRNCYNSADDIGDHVVIFNIKGNRYRLEVKIAYQRKTVFIRWFGTHREYDKRNRERKK